MAANVTPGNSGQEGGYFSSLTVPNVNGSFGGASVSGSLLSGATAGSAFKARNDRGSNVSVPYARVVLHPSSKTALPAMDKKKEDIHKPEMGYEVNMMTETYALHEGTLAFVLGRRGRYETSSELYDVMGLNNAFLNANNPAPNANFARTAATLYGVANGGSDIATFTRLCSFAYLERYFHHVLKKNVIDLTQQISKIEADDHKSEHRQMAKSDNFKLNYVDNKKLFEELRNVFKSGADPNPQTDKEKDLLARRPFSGICIDGVSPFLHGYVLDGAYIPDVRSKLMAKKPVPANYGDCLAFEELQKNLLEKGVFDWVPDGIVLNKLGSGDVLGDDALDEREGALYNVTIKGPATTSTWAGSTLREVLPLDTLIIAIVADLWTEEFPKLGEQERQYAEKKKTPVDDGFEPGEKPTNEPDAFAKLTNFRPRLTTSSELINYSEMKGGVEKGTETNKTSRLGLSYGKYCKEYIIGGWVIGRVIDSAASRAGPEGMSLVGGVKRARASNSCNVVVDIKYMSGDALFRKYDSRNGMVSSRVSSLHKDLQDKLNLLPASLAPTPPAPAPAPAPAPTPP